MPTTNSLFVRNCGFLSWKRIYFQGCHWSIQFTNYIPALSLEKTMYGYPKREKKSGLRTKNKSFLSGYSDLVFGIKGYPFYSSQLRMHFVVVRFTWDVILKWVNNPFVGWITVWMVCTVQNISSSRFMFVQV